MTLVSKSGQICCNAKVVSAAAPSLQEFRHHFKTPAALIGNNIAGIDANLGHISDLSPSNTIIID
ncbi:protein of unknown function [Agrobacterium pusense]|uniref:Uncharacterized protein n=1 Tax=Agrobacterium pusense TaxID=648995 RepID=U4PW69_9HYPH|nr:protein of unknown function [Agrobacterium pusense]